MSEFNLKERLDRLLEGTWSGAKRVQGLRGGAQGYVLSLIAENSHRPILIISPSVRDAENLYQDLGFFLGEVCSVPSLRRRLHFFPSWEVLPFEKLSPHPENLAGRLEGLYKIVEETAPILVSTPAALMQKVIPREALKQSYLYLVAGQALARESLLEHLVHWGFQNVPLVEEKGDFSSRGGIVDVYSPGYQRPLRLEFDGDRLESIREFNPATQRSAAPLEDMLLLPMKEFSLRRPGIEEVVRKVHYRAAELEIERQAKNSLLDFLRQGIPFPGMEFLSPYFYSSLSSFFAYLPAHTLIWLDGADRVETEVERFGELVWERHAKINEEGRFAPPVEDLYLNEHEWRDALEPFARVHGEALSVMASSGQSQESILTVNSSLTHDIHQEMTAIHDRELSMAPLVERLKKDWANEKVFFVASTAADAKRIRELLAQHDFPLAQPDHSLADLLARSELSRAVIIGQLSQGFRLPEAHLLLINCDEIFAPKRRYPAAATKAYPSHFLTSLSELKQDDYVVHLDHGIGIYRGLKFLKVAGVEGEFLHLEYVGGDRLYLPVDRINMVQKYIGGDGAQPSLDRLGGTSWEKVKAKTRKSILAMAEELVQLYALREARQGHGFAPPDSLYQEFEAAFEFEETP
ncbi:MAG TPA: CarD family transcriptional regulator, partial [Candidatus Binatia bacterium]|nr:CarD family transcriptional regulator [Candidatus Binatia bacterium]